MAGKTPGQAMVEVEILRANRPNASGVITIGDPLEPVSGEILAEKPPISHAMRFEMTIEPSLGMHAINSALAKASAEGRLPPPPTAELSCFHCGGDENFRNHATVKEAMVQIDTFLSAHSGCSRKGENDEHERREGRDSL